MEVAKEVKVVEGFVVPSKKEKRKLANCLSEIIMYFLTLIFIDKIYRSEMRSWYFVMNLGLHFLDSMDSYLQFFHIIFPNLLSYSLQPLHRELYSMHAANFFVPSFLKAINENSEESFRRIMSEPSPGIYKFEMLQPQFCEKLLSEVP